MSNNLEKKPTNLPADHDPADLYEAYGRSATARLFEGTLLRFVKGDYLAGVDSEPIEIGTQFVPLMELFAVGWTCWRDGIPVAQEMGLVIEGYQAKLRSELGDNDKALWEQDDRGEPRDPWQFTNHLPMYRLADHELFTFAVSGSKGGIAAIGKLSAEYGKEMRHRPNQRPVVEIGVDSYQHRNRSFGRIKIPVLTPIVGWVDIDEGPQLGSQSTPPNLPSDAAAEAGAEAAAEAAATRPAAAAKPAPAKSATAARPTLTAIAARSTTQKPAAAAKPTTGKPTAKTGTRI
jgi:hypothetical protein